MNTSKYLLVAILALPLWYSGPLFAQRVMERLDRGLVAIHQGKGNVYLGWRWLADDVPNIGFTIYRSSAGSQPLKLTTQPITGSTNYIDKNVDTTRDTRYIIKAVVKGREVEPGAAFLLPARAPVQPFFSIPLQVPPPGEVMGSKYSYSANDASVGDLDGDGRYEVVLKWEPSNAKNPPQTGFTGNQVLDAYTLEGKLLWRIDLGRNIRAGAAYTQFMVFDFDGDGRSEMMCKTADGTMDGKGKVIGDSTKDWRTYGDPAGPMYGKVVEGPEYITVFDGVTGAALATEAYAPDRYPLDGWGGIGGNGGNDRTGSRSDRFTACVAYLDGVLPSAVFVRGWYGRSVLAAWDWRGGRLTRRWVFDSSLPQWKGYSGMGNHNLSVADVDSDGKDEICIGAMTVDDNGKGLYTTGLRHGDALHLGDLDPPRPGLEVFGIHESEERTLAFQTPGVALFDARTGSILFSAAPGVDVGRGVAADIDPRYPGAENWGGPGGLRDISGKSISDKTPSSTNFVLWWDDDLTRELLDGNHIDKWDWSNQATSRLLTADGCSSNNGTKATPCLSADLLGDWREEVIWRTQDSKELRIYTTTIPSMRRFYTLMHDPQYRLSVAWQNAAYNQPPHTGYFLGAGMKPVTKPLIQFPKNNPQKK